MFLLAHFDCILSNQLGDFEVLFKANKKTTCLLKPFVYCIHKNTFQD